MVPMGLLLWRLRCLGGPKASSKCAVVAVANTDHNESWIPPRPKVLMLAVLLVSWQKGLVPETGQATNAGVLLQKRVRAFGLQAYNWLEFFAGGSVATTMLRYAGWKGARLDILYMTARPGKLNPMDLTSNAGMAFLSYCVLTVWLRPPKTQHFKGSSTH